MGGAAGSRGDARGVSPTIGVTVLVAIVVVLAAVMGTMAYAFEGELEGQMGAAAISAEYRPSGAGNAGVAYVNLTHTDGDVLDGDEVFVVDGDGNRVAWNDVWTGGPSVEPGEYVHIDGKGSDCALNEVAEGEVYRVVHAPADSDASTVLAEQEITSPPDTAVPPYTC